MDGAARTLALAVVVVLICAAPAAGLGINLSAASVGTLAPGTTATGASAPIVVTGLLTDAWALRVSASGSGHMARSGICNQGVGSLAAPLHMDTTRVLVTTTVDRPSYDLGSIANPVIAHGSTPDTVNVVYSQAVGSSELLVAGCVYSVTLTFTVAAS
ncbi:MAG: hypothetical protein QOG68_1293 [Solirubrobacteraceae bacterium]|nr:hypothetical protein [Solirubrobacteraceae bacterium]